jgi:hypothetical protein
MHRLLADYHRRLAKEAVLDVMKQYHSDLAQRLSDEAALIQGAQRLRSAFTSGSGRKGTTAILRTIEPAKSSACLIPTAKEKA